MKKLIVSALATILFFFATPLKAQQVGDIVGTDTLFSIIGLDSLYFGPRPIFLKGAVIHEYPGSFGISAGYETPFRSKKTTVKLPKGKVKIKEMDVSWMLDLNFIRQPFLMNKLWLNGGIAFKHQKQSLFYYSSIIQVGVLRTIYDGPVYTANVNRDVDKTFLGGRNYLTVGFAPQFGLNFEKRPTPKKYALFVKPQFWVIAGYNGFVQPNITTEFGIRYHIKDKETGVLRTGFYVKEKVKKKKKTESKPIPVPVPVP